MAIENRTTNEVYKLAGVLTNTLKSVMNYRSESRNIARTPEVDAALAALKTELDAAISDGIPVSPPENPAR